MTELDLKPSLLRSGWVVRYHQTPELAGMQTNAEHQWRVFALLYLYCDVLSESLANEALLHDAGELVSGDVSGPSKARYPAINIALKPIEVVAREDMGAPILALTDIETQWLKWADIAECVSFMRMKRPDLELRSDWKMTVDLARVRGGALGMCSRDIEASLS